MPIKTNARIGIVSLLLLSCLALAAQDNPYTKYQGFYVIVGEKPKAFSGIDNFVITEFNADRLSGRVVPVEGRVYEFRSAKLADGSLTFETRRVNGVGYSFTGRFLSAPPAPKDGRTPVIEGTMKRLRDGAPPEEAKLRFAFSEGGGE
jgi:hypothetical protein